MTDQPSPTLDPVASRPKVRLYVEQALGAGQHVSLSQAAAHYLIGVMRMAQGGEVALFNGTDGEWRARLIKATKRECLAECLCATARQDTPPDLWLLFAPIKKARTDFIVEKAAELGVRRILPVQTAFTNSERIRRDRLQAHAVEAAEQCGSTFVPPVDDLRPLAALLADWPAQRVLHWADEQTAADDASAIPGATQAPGATHAPDPAPAAILIGPEGGFSPEERARLSTLPFVRRINLGPRILRADTAAVAAIALWQAECGDWRQDPGETP